MTGDQKGQYDEACRADETAKSENQQAREKAQSKWESGLEQHLQNVQREINESIESFNQKRELFEFNKR